MAKNRRANAVIFGFDFQVNAAIVLMLENIDDLKALRLEGNYEDIELELNNGEYILAQAKAVEKSSTDFRNVRKNLKKALCSLSEGAQKSDATQLILITNSPNPLKEDSSKNLFLGPAYRAYETLPETSKALIDMYLNELEQTLDTSKFMIQILPFETDDKRERYKIVRRVVDDFIGDLNLNIPGVGKKLLGLWQNDVFTNGSKGDATIKLKKSDIVWPIMVLATGVERIDNKFSESFDASLYDEILYKYKEIIDSCCERCELFIKILSDYQSFETTKTESEKCLDFAFSKWEEYKSEFELDHADEKTIEGLIKIILYSVVRNRILINHIKKGVKL